MADEAKPDTSGMSQADVKKAVEEALKGIPGFSALLEAVQNLAQPIGENKPAEREQGGNPNKSGGKSRTLTGVIHCISLVKKSGCH